MSVVQFFFSRFTKQISKKNIAKNVKKNLKSKFQRIEIRAPHYDTHDENINRYRPSLTTTGGIYYIMIRKCLPLLSKTLNILEGIEPPLYLGFSVSTLATYIIKRLDIEILRSFDE